MQVETVAAAEELLRSSHMLPERYSLVGRETCSCYAATNKKKASTCPTHKGAAAATRHKVACRRIVEHVHYASQGHAVVINEMPVFGRARNKNGRFRKGVLFWIDLVVYLPKLGGLVAIEVHDSDHGRSTRRLKDTVKEDWLKQNCIHVESVWLKKKGERVDYDKIMAAVSTACGFTSNGSMP